MMNEMQVNGDMVAILNPTDAMVEKLAREHLRQKLVDKLCDLLEEISDNGFTLEIMDDTRTWEDYHRQNLFSDTISIDGSYFEF
jgi:hypothetical protein